MNYILLASIIISLASCTIIGMEKNNISSEQLKTSIGLRILIDKKRIDSERFEKEYHEFEKRLTFNDFDPVYYRQIKATQVMYLKTLTALYNVTRPDVPNINHHIFSGIFDSNECEILNINVRVANQEKKSPFPFLISAKIAYQPEMQSCYFSFANCKNSVPRYYHAFVNYCCPYFDSKKVDDARPICSEFTRHLLDLELFKKNNFITSDELISTVESAYRNYIADWRNLADWIYLSCYHHHIGLFFSLIYEKFKKPHYVSSLAFKAELAYALPILQEAIHTDPIKIFFAESNDLNIEKIVYERTLPISTIGLPAKIQEQMTASASKKKKQVKKNKKGKLFSTAPDSENNNCTQPEQEPERVHDASVPDSKGK